MGWLQVIDDAVKIGLGALIGGGWVYIQTRTNARQEAEKERASTTVSMIREIAGDIDSFHTEFMSYVRLVEISGDLDTIKDTMMARRALANVKNRRSEGDEAFLNLRKSAMEKNNALTMAGTLISLLGVEPLEGALSGYRKAAEDFWLSAGEDGALTVQEFEQLYPGILGARREFFRQLKQALP
jgi:hypothetical protein